MNIIKEDFICPNCKNKSRIKVYQELTNDNLDDIIKNKIFKYKCKKCNEELILNYPTKYITDEFHIYYETNKKEIIDSFPLSRVCYSLDDFKEKIMILSDHLNDIVICFIKCYIMDSLGEDSKLVSDIKYNNIEDEKIFFYLIGLNEYASVPFSFYQNLLKKCKIKNPKKCVSIDIYNFRKYFKMRSII